MTPVPEDAAAVHVRVAGFWRRALAGMLDGGLLLSIGVVFNVVTALLLGQPLPRLGQIGPDYLLDVAMGGSLMAQIAATLLAILCFLYFFIFHALRGQTPPPFEISLAS